jgi:NAD(P)-dependent dehydrogenase (short-subunit alcohol dehydrogenase family)
LRAIKETKGEGDGEGEGEGFGSIVNATSIQGLRGFAQHAAYSASKHGVIGLTRSVAKEVAPDIRVNAVAP